MRGQYFTAAPATADATPAPTAIAGRRAQQAITATAAATVPHGGGSFPITASRHAAQQESLSTSAVNDWAVSLRSSDIVRYGAQVLPRSSTRRPNFTA